MNKETLVTLRTFSNVIDAEVALGHLESQGIKAFIKKDDSGGMRPHFQLTHGVEIIILEKDLKKGERVLAAMKV
jgi:hypothetical protein